MPAAIELYDGKYWKVLLNPDQNNLGKSLVVLKADKVSLGQISGDEWEEFGIVVKQFEQVVREQFNPTHFNWQCLMNNAYEQNATETPHVHWYATPRYAHPVMVGDHEFVDKNYPRTNKIANLIEPAALEQIAQKITIR